MSVIAITQVNNDLFSIVNHVFQTNERVVISQKGEDVAAIIGPEDIQFLKSFDELEDRVFTEMADEAMQEPGENISLQKMKNQFGRQ